MERSVRVWRIVFAVYQLLMVLMGLAVVVGGISLYAAEPMAHLLLPHDALVTLIGGGLVTAIVALGAFFIVGVRKRRTDGERGARRRWIVIDAVLMAVLAVGFFLAAILLLQQQAEISSMVKRRFSRFWDQASSAFITDIQGQGQCCGFSSYDDRTLEPCQKYSEQVGCWTVLRDEYRYYLRHLLPVLFGMGAITSAASLLAIALLITRIRAAVIAQTEKDDYAVVVAAGGAANDNNSNGDQLFKIKRSQPFDAWHKAVFSA